MQLGVTFPTTEIGSDPGAIRDFAQTAEGLGYHNLGTFDHVLGADVSRRDASKFPYTHKTQFHEPLVLFAYLAGLTKTLRFTTTVLVITQRQTVLAAKQAAEVDVLSGGRLRLGLGSGWNEVEYEALGEDFATRGKRLDEQIALMRALWTDHVVTFNGRWHKIFESGLNPLPVQRPIPLWFGGKSERMLRRIGELGDGWLPFTRQGDPIEDARRGMERIRHYAREAGRDPAAIGLEARIWMKDGTPEDWRRLYEGWQKLGATHLAVSTLDAGFSPAQHIDTLRRFRKEVAP